MLARILLLCLWLGSGCNADPGADPPQVRGVQKRGELAWDGTVLTYSLDEERAEFTTREPWPYQIVAQGVPALVTVLGDELEPATWAIGDSGELTGYPGWIPAVSMPPLSLLITLPRGEADAYQGIRLLDQAGQVIWEHDNAVLLSPAWGEAADDLVLLATAEKGNVFTPLGEGLSILLLDPATGQSVWELNPGAQYAAAGIELWIVNGQYGLVALQYGHQQYEFISVDLVLGARVDAYQLMGQPFYGLIYPGMFDEPIVETDTDGLPVVRVFPLGTEPVYLRLDPATGKLSTSGELPLLPQPVREENPHPVGGMTSPAPGTEPFPIDIFPTADHSAWQVPALVDGEGDVLVISAQGASWMPPKP